MKNKNTLIILAIILVLGTFLSIQSNSQQARLRSTVGMTTAPLKQQTTPKISVQPINNLAPSSGVSESNDWATGRANCYANCSSQYSAPSDYIKLNDCMAACINKFPAPVSNESETQTQN